jgi:VWFA-related protein
MTEWDMESRRRQPGAMGVRTAEIALVACLLIGFFPVFARAQKPANPSRPPAATPAPSSADGSDQQPVFQTEIQVVTVPVTVTDSSGEFVTDLNAGEFRLLDNGEPQRLENFELSWEPVSMVIVAETSTRVQDQLGEIGRSGILFTQLILGESGEAAVVTFGRDINVAQGFTDDADVIEGALKKLKPSGDNVRLSDAVSRALTLLQQRPKDRRKVIVILAEARDNGSSNKPGFVLRGAQQLGVSIYTVGLSSLKTMAGRPGSNAGSSPFPPGVAAMPTPGNTPPTPSNQTNLGAANVDMLPIIAELVSYAKNIIIGNPLALYAQGTGAEEFSGSDKDSLEHALGRIGRELHSQYLITYRPNNLDKPMYHSIQATVTRPGLHVRTRPGYMYGGKVEKSGAPAPPSASESSPTSDK